MSNLIKEIINSKIKQITKEQILHYSKDYGFSITNEEAAKIAAYLKTNQIDPFHVEDRMKMYKELASITNIQTANKAQKLFNQMIKSYGLEHLF